MTKSIPAAWFKGPGGKVVSLKKRREGRALGLRRTNPTHRGKEEKKPSELSRDRSRKVNKRGTS